MTYSLLPDTVKTAHLKLNEEKTAKTKMTLESMKLCCRFIGSTVKKYYVFSYKTIIRCLGLNLQCPVN